MNHARALALVALMAIAAVAARPAEPRAMEQVALAQLPYAIAGWSGTDDEPVDRATAEQLRADAYLTRSYTTPGRDSVPVDLYVAYYGSQRPGVSIHSPLHCLPGTGWEPIDLATVALPAAGGSAGSVRQLIVRKHLDRAAVIYWYQMRDRVVASEMKSKMFLLWDSVHLRRSDAALVRVVVPVTDEPATASRRALEFVRDLVPQLGPILG